MKEDALIQYGVAIDPKHMVAPPDITELELDPLTPGLDDPDYVARRRFLFDLCRRHRLENLGPPIVEYLPEEVRVWRGGGPQPPRARAQEPPPGSPHAKTRPAAPPPP